MNGVHFWWQVKAATRIAEVAALSGKKATQGALEQPTHEP